jgi:AcrR family transcriptional regulator
MPERSRSRAPGRREQQTALRERRILRAAQELFGRRGYHETAMEQVARRAGLAVGTIYNYFPSKAELVLALLRRETAATLAAGEAVLAAAPADPAAAVTALFDVYVDLLARHERSQLRELVAASLAQPETIGRAAFEMDLRLLAQLHELLCRLRETGALAADVEPGAAAAMLYAVYVTWLFAFAASETVTVEQARAQVRSGVGLAVRGLLPAAGERRARRRPLP